MIIDLFFLSRLEKIFSTIFNAFLKTPYFFCVLEGFRFIVDSPAFLHIFFKKVAKHERLRFIFLTFFFFSSVPCVRQRNGEACLHFQLFFFHFKKLTKKGSSSIPRKLEKGVNVHERHISSFKFSFSPPLPPFWS